MTWLRRLFHKGRAESELDKELQFHLDGQIASYVAGRPQSRRGQPSCEAWVWRYRTRQRRSPRHALGNSPGNPLPRFPLRPPQSADKSCAVATT